MAEQAEQVQALQETVEAQAGELAALRGLVRGPQRHEVKAPKFSGRDIEQFLDTFETVRVANDWDNGTASLHFKLSLEGSTSLGVTGETYEELRQSLRRKYQPNQEEARALLRHTRLKQGDSIYEFGEQLLQLVQLAHPLLTDEQQSREAILCLTEAVGDRQLTHEFRLQPPESFPAALESVRNFQRDMGKDRRLVQQLEVKEEGDRVARLEKTVTTLKEQLAAVSLRQERSDEVMQQLSSDTNRKLDQLLNRDRTPRACYRCGERGHLQRNCPRPARQQGNGKGPSA